MKENQSSLTVRVSNGLAVNVIPHPDHVFTMSTEMVAKGYGVTTDAIRMQKSRNEDEFIEGKHFFTSVTNSYAGKPPVKTTYWTKRGVVRLGFFIKSENAKHFRDWAEDFICKTIGLDDADVKYVNGHPVRILSQDGKTYIALSAYLKAINTKTSVPQTVKMLAKKGIECLKTKLPTDLQLTWYAPIESEQILKINTRISKDTIISTELMLALTEVEPRELRMKLATLISEGVTTKKGGNHA